MRVVLLPVPPEIDGEYAAKHSQPDSQSHDVPRSPPTTLPTLAARWLGIHSEGGENDANSEKNLKEARYADATRIRPFRLRDTSGE